MTVHTGYYPLTKWQSLPYYVRNEVREHQDGKVGHINGCLAGVNCICGFYDLTATLCNDYGYTLGEINRLFA